ncbi:MAG: divalent-cation tolerance protein CutA [Candidatus Omnitrophica bacterium]|nr:divalent-cation tolerance protein CutA [Candidatus Omnitrophota bacterium]MCM8798788.1 divalent-cation tolerance protein CutA [Candidatus Omnitrophota bacterium]
MRHYFVVYITTADQREAEEIAQILLEKKLAACVNIIPGITSLYRWQGKIEKSKELLLVVKTRKDLFERLVKEVKKHHSYTVPEIIATEIEKGDQTYLKWLEGSVK